MKPTAPLTPLLTQRLERHLAGCSAMALGVASFVGSGDSADAQIVYSGIQNIPVFPGSVNGGVYIDLDTFTVTQGSPHPAGWELNPYFSGKSLYVNSNTAVVTIPGDIAANLALGAQVGPASSFSGTGFYGGVQIPVGQTGYIGFSFDPDAVPGAQTLYGWFHLSVGDNVAGAGNVIEWAYNSTGAAIAVGNVPEPSSIALLALGVTGLMTLRRRRGEA